MILSEIIKLIENKYPKNLAYEWDNVGLLAGSPENDINTVLLTLDVTPYVVREAVNLGADLIISHHPLIFSGIKSFCETDSKTKMYTKIIRHNIAVYSAHTNMDTAPEGINQKLAELFCLTDIQPLDKATGLGRIGDIKETTLKDFAETVKNKLCTPFVKISGDPEKIIKRAAIGSGACAELADAAAADGADVLLTADIKYHNAIDSVCGGIAMIDAGHYPTEIIVMDMFEDILKNTGLQIKKSKNEDIFSII